SVLLGALFADRELALGAAFAMENSPSRTKAALGDDPRVASVFIALVTYSLVVFFWRAGLLQVAEFHVYDRFVEWRANPSPGESRAVVIEITERDIQRLETYPV